MIKFLIASAFLLFFSSAHADECDDKFIHGKPKTPIETREICRPSMLIKYYDECKVPLYVAEYIDPKNLNGPVPRDEFAIDRDIPHEFRSYHEDYAKSGFDRGHMAPAANFQNNEQFMKESFILSNINPQYPSVNRGIWSTIEERARYLAEKNGGVYAITGAIYGTEPKKIGNGVCVPVFLYKVIFHSKEDQGVAYIVPNISKVASFIDEYRVPVSMIEQFTAIDFTPEPRKGGHGKGKAKGHDKSWKKNVGKDMKKLK